MSRSVGRVLVEGLVVGAALIPIGLGVSTLMWLPRREEKAFGPVGAMAIGLGASGFIFHILAEATGVNRQFCKSY